MVRLMQNANGSAARSRHRHTRPISHPNGRKNATFNTNCNTADNPSERMSPTKPNGSNCGRR